MNPGAGHAPLISLNKSHDISSRALTRSETQSNFLCYIMQLRNVMPEIQLIILTCKYSPVNFISLGICKAPTPENKKFASYVLPSIVVTIHF